MMDLRIAVNAADTGFNGLQRRRAHQIELIEHHHIGKRHLVGRLRAIGQPRLEIQRIHHGHNRIQPRFGLHILIDKKRLSDRRRVGEPRRLDDNPVEFFSPLHQPADNADQIPPHRAADAAVIHLENFLIGLYDKVVIHAQLPELINDHGIFLAMTLGENPVQQRCFTGAQIAGQHGHRDQISHLQFPLPFCRPSHPRRRAQAQERKTSTPTYIVWGTRRSRQAARYSSARQ